MAILRQRPPNGGVECKGIEKILIFEFRPISRFFSEIIQHRAIVSSYYGMPIETCMRSVEWYLFSYPLAFDAFVRGVPVGISPPRSVWKKIRRYLYSFWRNSRTWQTDRLTDRHRMSTYTALMHMHRAVIKW